MDNSFEKIKYFGIAYDKYEVLDFTSDFLAGVRANYFNSGMQRQKGKAVQKIQNVTYSFSYDFSKGKSAGWLLKANDRVIQSTGDIYEDSYCIESYCNNDFIYKN